MGKEEGEDVREGSEKGLTWNRGIGLQRGEIDAGGPVANGQPGLPGRCPAGLVGLTRLFA